MICVSCSRVIRKKTHFKRCRHCVSVRHVKCVIDSGCPCTATKKPASIRSHRFQKLLVGYPSKLNGLVTYGEWVDRTLNCGYRLTMDGRNILILNSRTGKTVSVTRLYLCQKLLHPGFEYPMFTELRDEFTKDRPLILPTPFIS